MKFYLVNKNYFLWLLWVWFVFCIKGFEFIEDFCVFDVENNYVDFFEFFLMGKVLVFVDEGCMFWELLVIFEYFVEKKLEFWLEDFVVCVEVCCVVYEMYVGFLLLCFVCLMNL